MTPQVQHNVFPDVTSKRGEKSQSQSSNDLSLLGSLYRYKPSNHYILIWCKLPNDKKVSKFFLDFRQAQSYALEQKENADVYFGLGTSSIKKNNNQRFKYEDVEGLSCLFVDVDYGTNHKKKNLPLTQQDAIALVNRMPLEPTMIVDSGNGLHVYWQLDNFFVIDSEEKRSRIASVNSAWQLKLKEIAAEHDWTIDATQDLARLLRVPDTLNRKDENDVKSVKLLFNSHVTFSIEKLESYLICPTAAQKPKRENNDIETLKVDFELNKDAQPNLDKFLELMSEEPRFRLSWEHKRKDFADQSASTYDLSLATISCDAGWANQEVVNLLIAHRRKYGEDLKLRQDYYLRTLTKARTSRNTITTVETFEDLTEAEEIKDSLIQSTDDKRQKAIRFLNRKLNMKTPIVEVQQHGLEYSNYVFVLANGETINLGDSDAIHQPSKVRNKLFNADVIMPREVSKEWDKILKAIRAAHKLEYTISEAEELRSYVLNYFHLMGSAIDMDVNFDYSTYSFAVDFNEEDKAKLAKDLERRKLWGFCEASTKAAWIRSSTFIEWLNRCNGSKRWTQREVITMFSRQGFRKREKGVRYNNKDGKSIVYNTGDLWVSPDGYLPDSKELMS